MKYFFLSIEGSYKEREWFHFLKKNIWSGIQTIRPEAYTDGCLFLPAQTTALIKGNTHRINTGIRLGGLLKPDRAVILYEDVTPTTLKPCMVNLADKDHLIENIRKAAGCSAPISWLEMEAAFPETYGLERHDDEGLKKLWNRQRQSRKITAIDEKTWEEYKDESKEILIVDDEYRYFQREMETAVKRRFPNWDIQWADDEKQAEQILRENFHLDMAILDLEFRETDIEGKELLEQLRKGKEKDFFFPILVFSRCRDVDIIEEIIKPQGLGADDYVSKFDILRKSNFNLLVSLMAMHMNRYEQVHDMQKILAPDVDVEIDGFHIYGKSKPFVEVGGDVIDCIRHEEGLTVYLADAVNHGFDAGLLSGMFKAALKTALEDATSLLESVRQVDRVLCQIKKESQKRLGFILTTVLMRFSRGKRVEIVNSGHLPVLHFRHATQDVAVLRLANRDRALGMREQGNERQTMEVAWEAGDLFVLFSDGISETKGRGEADFGIDGLSAIIQKHGAKPPSAICDRIFEAVRKHGRQTDDRTLLLIRCK